MANSLAEMLRSDMECEGLLECFHGLKELDKRCFQELVDAETAVTIDELAEQVDRERSTVYRSVQRLLNAGLIQKEQINYDQGGYYHVYKPADPEAIREDMQRLLNDWYAEIGQLIQEFEDKYSDAADTSVPAES